MNITTSAQRIAVFRTYDDGSENDRCWSIYAWYSKVSVTVARIYFKCVFESNASIWGGTASISASGSGGQASSGDFSYGSWTEKTISYDVTYESNGTWANKNFTVSMTASNARWGNNDVFAGGLRNSSTYQTYSLPAIDPTPSASISSFSILNNTGLSGNYVASFTKLRVNISASYVRSMTVKWETTGYDSGNQTVTVQYSSSQSPYYDMTIPVPANSNNYQLKFIITYGNNSYGGLTAEKIAQIIGYWLPTYNTSTYTQRCDVNGNADAQGEYGRLYLTWKYASINSANSMQSITTKLNGVTLVNGQNCVITGSISAGYLNYIFPLQLSTQGDLSISMNDRIATATINSLAVPKSIMPLALYQDNTNVGVTIGRMATQAGFYEALDFYLKGQNHGTFYNIYIDTSGVLHVGGYSVSYVGGNPA